MVTHCGSGKPKLKQVQRQVDPILLNTWLMTDNQRSDSLELTLKVWGAYAGDSLGPRVWMRSLLTFGDCSQRHTTRRAGVARYAGGADLSANF